jgi:predicted ATPase
MVKRGRALDHPLRSWHLQNFKSIREASIDFAPLTVLVGANSSGKSSVLQSILLAAQAAQGDARGANLPLNGPLTSLGGFADVRSAFADRGQAVRIGGSIVLDPRTSAGVLAWIGAEEEVPDTLEATWGLSIDAPAVDEPGSASISRVEVIVSRGEATAEGSVGPTPLVHLRIDRRGQGPIAADAEQARVGRLVSPTREEFALGFQGELRVQGHDAVVDVHGAQFLAGVPESLLTRWTLGQAAARVWVQVRTERPYWSGTVGLGPRGRGATQYQGWRTKRWPRERAVQPDDVEALLTKWASIAAEEIHRWRQLAPQKSVPLPIYLGRERSSMDQEERFLLRQLSPDLVERIEGELSGMDEPVLLPPEADIASGVRTIADEVSGLLRDRIVYLGPLRQDPQVVYRSTPFGATGFIGTKGEYMAPVLHAFRSQQVDLPQIAGNPGRAPLLEAVDYWVRELELAESVRTRDIGRLGIQVTVKRSEDLPALDLTSVGVGVSQILPVIVTCLRTPPGSVILLEQPELHLHPAVQQKLGDFLLAMAKSGRQLIVETHSEYLVSRLRLRIAEDKSDETLSYVRLVFAEQEGDVSEFRAIPTDEFGAIHEWPKGFFDQAATEARRILEEGLAKRLAAANKGGSR